MINKEEVISFFDLWADRWDDNIIKDDDIISKILDGAHVYESADILDVACGTGVLIPYYLERKVKTIDAIDVSKRMIEIAESKFKYDNLKFILGDAETFDFKKKYDSIVIYNAFPHFADPEHLIKVLCEYLKDGGYLTVAHGMSREKLNMHHSGSASHISNMLLSANELATIFSKCLRVTDEISNEKMYQVTGKKVR